MSTFEKLKNHLWIHAKVKCGKRVPFHTWYLIKNHGKITKIP